MRLVLLVSALLAILIAALALDLQPRGRSPADPSPREETIELGRLQQEVRSLRVESAQLRRLVARRDAPIEADVGWRAAPTAETASPDSSEPSFEGYWTEVDRHFSAETIDERWTARDELARKLTEVLPRTSRLLSLECRSTMCRLETAHPSDQSYREFASHFEVHPDAPPIWTGPAIFRVLRASEGDGDGLVGVALLAREAFPSSTPQLDSAHPTKETRE